jgi:hypothetical protein
VEELIQIIRKGENKFQVMGKSYILNLILKHEETSTSDPDHKYFRSGNSVVSSAETPTLDNSESRETTNPNFLLPQLKIQIGQP